MNFYVVKETDSGKFRTIDSVWSIEEVKQVSLWNVLMQCKTKLESKTFCSVNIYLDSVIK